MTIIKTRRPVAVKSTDPRKPAIVAALKDKYNCRKITCVEHDRDNGRFIGNTMNYNTTASATVAYQGGAPFVLAADIGLAPVKEVAKPATTEHPRIRLSDRVTVSACGGSIQVDGKHHSNRANMNTAMAAARKIIRQHIREASSTFVAAKPARTNTTDWTALDAAIAEVFTPDMTIAQVVKAVAPTHRAGTLPQTFYRQVRKRLQVAAAKGVATLVKTNRTSREVADEDRRRYLAEQHLWVAHEEDSVDRADAYYSHRLGF